jgi:hypothetical protein
MRMVGVGPLAPTTSTIKEPVSPPISPHALATCTVRTHNIHSLTHSPHAPYKHTIFTHSTRQILDAIDAIVEEVPDLKPEVSLLYSSNGIERPARRAIGDRSAARGGSSGSVSSSRASSSRASLSSRGGTPSGSLARVRSHPHVLVNVGSCDWAWATAGHDRSRRREALAAIAL